jgi:hypothetical protein
MTGLFWTALAVAFLVTSVVVACCVAAGRADDARDAAFYRRLRREP